MSCLNQSSNVYDSIPQLESWYKIKEPIQNSTSTKIKCHQKTVSFSPDPIIFKKEHTSLLQYNSEEAPSSCFHLLHGIHYVCLSLLSVNHYFLNTSLVSS